MRFSSFTYFACSNFTRRDFRNRFSARDLYWLVGRRLYALRCCGSCSRVLTFVVLVFLELSLVPFWTTGFLVDVLLEEFCLATIFLVEADFDEEGLLFPTFFGEVFVLLTGILTMGIEQIFGDFWRAISRVSNFF